MTPVPSGAMEVSSGRYVDPLNFKKEDASLEDIAHSLGAVSRFTGHTSRRYSVGEHSILCAEICERLHPNRPMLALKALLHDAHEAYLNDIPSPWKPRLLIELGEKPLRYNVRYHEVCDQVQSDIELQLLGETASYNDRVLIKQIDLLALRIEAFFLMPSKGEGWFVENHVPLIDGFGVHPYERPSNQVKKSFIKFFTSRIKSAWGIEREVAA